MLKFIKSQPRLVLLVAFILLVGLSFTGCDSGSFNDETNSTYNLTIEVKGEGTVEPAEGSHEYDDGATATLEVTPDGGYEFKEWTGNNGDEIKYDSEDDIYKLLMNLDKEITAVFEQKEDADSIEPGEMVLVEAGTTSSNNGSITVDNNFYIGKYHVTQVEFEAVMGFNPSHFNDDDHQNLTGGSDNRPVESVTWYDAVQYCNKLSEREGLDKYYNINGETITENADANGYRLPTVNEFKYAARGGKNGDATTYAGNDDLNEVGWYRYNSDVSNSDRTDKLGTMPVGEKEPNELGLFDMSGNVWDWTNTASGSYRVKHGGGWINNAGLCEVSGTYTHSPSFKTNDIGFRLTRSP